jgi:hypothetical protein
VCLANRKKKYKQDTPNPFVIKQTTLCIIKSLLLVNLRPHCAVCKGTKFAREKYLQDLHFHVDYSKYSAVTTSQAPKKKILWLYRLPTKRTLSFIIDQRNCRSYSVPIGKEEISTSSYESSESKIRKISMTIQKQLSHFFRIFVTFLSHECNA